MTTIIRVGNCIDRNGHGKLCTTTSAELDDGRFIPVLEVIADYTCAECGHGLLATDEDVACPECGSREITRRGATRQLEEEIEVIGGLPAELRAAAIAALRVPVAEPEPLWSMGIDRTSHPEWTGQRFELPAHLRLN
jgi:DNA-directed RNA polymerase subunit RPC12/RpoP